MREDKWKLQKIPVLPSRLDVLLNFLFWVDVAAPLSGERGDPDAAATTAAATAAGDCRCRSGLPTPDRA